MRKVTFTVYYDEDSGSVGNIHNDMEGLKGVRRVIKNNPSKLVKKVPSYREKPLHLVQKRRRKK